MLRILLTGATGFLGSRLAPALHSISNVELTLSVRRQTGVSASRVVQIDDLSDDTDWSIALTNQQVVIHGAARNHVMEDELASSLVEYRRTNVEGTLSLARQAAKAGVKRFIFISSIKVNGEQTLPGQQFTAEDIPAPEDSYGRSKYEAEMGLEQLASETGLEVVIIRPPLVYGLGVKGNFASMIELVAKGVPLPLGAIHNSRSLVAVDNLIDLITLCLEHPAAANQVFLVSDGKDLSITNLLRGLSKAMGKQSRLVPVPPSLLIFGAHILGQKKMAQRLVGSLQVDISKTRDLLGWEPPIMVEEGLRRCFVQD